ncbi:MAG: DUF1905 domain-containing protein [Actinomycetales bacterium]
MTSPELTFTSRVWLWSGNAAWHFVSLPEDVADEIEALSVGLTRGFGSVRVEVTCKDVRWRTSLFPDRKTSTYLLPLKKQVRDQLGLRVGSRVTITVQVLIDQPGIS